MEKAGRKKVKELDVMVADVVRETPDTTTLVLFTGNDRLDYEPGHFLMIDPHQFHALDRFTRYLEDQKGRKESPRAYSLASSPHERFLSITIKEEQYVSGQTSYPPLLSPLLVNRIDVGTQMTVMGFTGPYTLTEASAKSTDHLVHICAGSGIVPNFSILKYALAHYPELRHTLIFGNKCLEDVIYRQALDALEAAHSDRLRVVHTLSREGADFSYSHRVRAGRVSRELIEEFIEDTDTALFYVCGPAISPFEVKRARERGEQPVPRFMESTLAILDALGVTKDRIKRESYG